MNLSHRFLRLQLVDGQIEVFAGPPIATAICLAVDPALTRAEWRYAIEELFMRAFNMRKAGPSGGASDPLERLAARARTPPPLDPVTVQLCEMDFSSPVRDGVFRFVCSRGAYGTSARANLIVDTSRFPNGGGVQGMLGALSQWIANRPDDFFEAMPAPSVDERANAPEAKATAPAPIASPARAGAMLQ
jgi:hypothetical protein